MSKISLIVGLGNMGRRYEGTRHNAGFAVLDHLVERLRVPGAQWTRFDCRIEFRRSGRRMVMAWPRTYMNRSGEAVEALLQDYTLTPSEMVVVVDDFNLPLGRLRLRKEGSEGGHNGLASIIETIGTEEFPRIRLGIGPAPEGVDPADFVLAPFDESERETVQAMIETAGDAVIHSIDHRFDEAMNIFNANPAR